MNSAVLFSFLVLVVQHVMMESNDWPSECAGKSYCTLKPADYPEAEIAALLAPFNLTSVDPAPHSEDRNGVDAIEEVCFKKSNFSTIYLLIDENDQKRYAVQIPDRFMQKHFTEECLNPGPLTSGGAIFSDAQVTQFNVSCVESKLPQKFLVLSLDRKSLDLAIPKGGLSVTCLCRYNAP